MRSYIKQGPHCAVGGTGITGRCGRRASRSVALSALISSLLSVAPAISAEEPEAASAVGGDAAAEMARKLQNPLASIRAVMTDNTVGFNTGHDDGTSFGFQIQPVYAFDFPDQGFTFLPRAVIPVVGLEPGTDNRFVGEPTPAGSERVWGLGDSVVQLFFAPHMESGWKFGVGPQLSFKTRTDSRLGGPDWGAGVAAIVVGDLTDNLSFAGILGNHWSFDGNFSTLTLQPMFFYNFDAIPGAYVAYNAVISVDWKASASNTWTVPVGFSVGRTVDMGSGNGLDVMIGPYYNAARPDGSADWLLRFGMSWLFP